MVSFETGDVIAEVGEAQLLETEDELAGPIKEAKKARLSNTLLCLVNITYFERLVLRN